MNIEKECLKCIYNQSKRVSNLLNLTFKESKEIENIAQLHIDNFNFNSTPPHNAVSMYEVISEYLNISDIYEKVKKE